ncbi:MAG: adenylate cyclase, class 2 [Patescibacteria group bacterium]|nr:adenylate cyclase, class 2 [Patescibacteria group bacterium]
MSDTEHELRLVDIDPTQLEEKLIKAGATFVADHKLRRHVFDTIPVNNNRWVRLRTDGSQTTLAVKEVVDETVSGTKEWETVVDDFDTTKLILEKMGLISRGYQENSRKEFRLGEASITIDQWPKLPVILEVEADSAEGVVTAINKLDLNPDDFTGKNIDQLYKDRGIDLANESELSFKL